MVKLSFYSPKYFEYMKDGKMVNKCVYECEVVDNDLHEVINSFKVEGYSMCSADDTYDVSRGNIIADSRAKSKAYTIARDMFSNHYIHQLNKKIELYNKLIAFHKKMQYLKQQEDKHLNYVLNK